MRNDDFYHNTALQCWNNAVTIGNDVAILCCANCRRCEMSRVTSPLLTSHVPATQTTEKNDL